MPETVTDQLADYLGELNASPIPCWPNLRPKWILSKGHAQLVERNDPRSQREEIFIRLNANPPSKLKHKLLDAIEVHAKDSSADDLLGSYAISDHVLGRILDSTFTIMSDRVSFDIPKAISKWQDYEALIAAPTITEEAFARLHGVELEINDFQFELDVKLVRLSQDEMNDRQPFLQLYLENGAQDYTLLENSTEI